MDQNQAGEHLRALRKAKGLTQEQLAERFGVSSRTVSRWETGGNLPDVATLLELADFYETDIRALLCPEETAAAAAPRDTLRTVANYAAKQEKGRLSQTAALVLGTLAVVLVCTVLLMGETKGLLYGVLAPALCRKLLVLVYVLAATLLIAYLRARLWGETPTREPEKTVFATVQSRQIVPGTHGAGRSKGGFSYVVNFCTDEGETLQLFAHEIEYGGLREGTHGMLTYRGRYFVDFAPQP